MLEDQDLLEIRVDQELLGEDLINVFYYLYQLVVDGVLLTDVIADFLDDVWGFIRPAQNDDLTALNCQCTNLTNGVDVDDVGITLAGLDLGGGASLPTYVAAGFRLNVPSRTTRPGGKRIAGISDDRVTLNAYDAGGTVSADIEDALAAVVPVVGAVAGSGFIQPVIIGRDLLGHLDLLRFQNVNSASVAATIRSQVSRRA